MMKGAELFYGSSFTSSCTTTPRCSQGLCTCSSSTSAREQKFCKHSNRYGWAGWVLSQETESREPFQRLLCYLSCCLLHGSVISSEVAYQQTSLALRADVYYSSVPPEIVISGTASHRENRSVVSLSQGSLRDRASASRLASSVPVPAVRLPCLQGCSGRVLLFCYSPGASNPNSGVFARGSPAWHSYAQIAGGQG